MSSPVYLILFTFLPTFCFSQIGANARYFFGKSDILGEEFISQDGIQVSAEYHFRLKEKRLEFKPGLGYRYTFRGNLRDGDFQAVDFDFNTSIYPFDFAGDCDCPTFSKEGNLFKKGFFLEVAPGMSFMTLSRLESEILPSEDLPIRSKNFVWKLGGAIGLDIGITENFTFTPLFTATMLSASDWEGLKEDGSTGRLDDYLFIGPGFRVTYDQSDKRRRRRN